MAYIYFLYCIYENSVVQFSLQKIDKGVKTYALEPAIKRRFSSDPFFCCSIDLVDHYRKKKSEFFCVVGPEKAKGKKPKRAHSFDAGSFYSLLFWLDSLQYGAEGMLPPQDLRIKGWGSPRSPR